MAVPTNKVWLTHGLCTWMLHPGDLSACCQSNVALLPHPKPLLWDVWVGKPEATLQLGSVGLELGELCPWKGRARQSCSTGYSVQKPFLRVLALFRAKEMGAGEAPLNTALRQGCPALAPPPCLGVQPPVLRAGGFLTSTTLTVLSIMTKPSGLDPSQT